MAAEEPAWPMRPESESRIVTGCYEQSSEINALALFKYATVDGNRKVTDECISQAQQQISNVALQCIIVLSNEI